MNIVKNLSLALIPGLILAMTVSCAGTPDELEDQIEKSAYLKHNIWYESRVHKTTNYLVGTRLPVNAKVTILDISSDEIKIRPEEYGIPIIIANIEEHSGADITAIYNRMFSSEPVQILSKNATRAVGQPYKRVAPGMTKDEVIQAIGYPPAHRTPTLGNNEWIYWVTRTSRIKVLFENNKVIDVTEPTGKSKS